MKLVCLAKCVYSCSRPFWYNMIKTMSCDLVLDLRQSRMTLSILSTSIASCITIYLRKCLKKGEILTNTWLLFLTELWLVLWMEQSNCHFPGEKLIEMIMNEMFLCMIISWKHSTFLTTEWTAVSQSQVLCQYFHILNSKLNQNFYIYFN